MKALRFTGLFTLVFLFLSVAATAAEDTPHPDMPGSVLATIAEGVELSGLLEVEAGVAGDNEGEDASDITLSTVEVGLDAGVTDWAQGHLLFKWEEDGSENVELDEGTVTLGNTEKFPVFVKGGKMYVPFGNFETFMISDPLTLELGETRESALLVGFKAAGLYGSAYGFKGDVRKTGDDDQIKSWGASLGYAYEGDTFSLDLGADWINNLLDANNYGDWLLGEHEDAAGNPAYLGMDGFTAGFGAHAILTVGPVTVIGEYLGAAEDPEYQVFDAATEALLETVVGERPASWGVEAGYVFEVLAKDVSLAVAYQGTENCLMLELPEARFLASVGVALNEFVVLALEYAHDEDYGEADGGTGKEADAGTLQLALSF